MPYGRISVLQKRAAAQSAIIRVWDIPTCKRSDRNGCLDPACQVLKKSETNLLMFRTVNIKEIIGINLE